MPSTVNLLLQHDEEQQFVQAQTIQMITALLLSDADETPAQFQIFLPQVTR